MEKHKETILKYCLQNAVFYNGKATPGAVMGKVLAENPKLKGRAGELGREIALAVKEVNKLSLEEQKKQLEKMAPDLMEKKERERQGLPELDGAVMGKVATRFAPAPTGPLNIAHLLRAVLLSYIYAKRYKGQFILRFEDTNPRNIKKEYYKRIEEDLKSAGVKPDRVVKESSHLERCHKLAEQLIREGRAYVCTCSAESFRELKKKKGECPCRKRGSEENLPEWGKMLKGYKEGQAVVRLRTSMKDPNPVLRDPPILRIAEGEHPFAGKKCRVWPLYNFVCAIEDHDLEITHVFRAKEHEHNTAVQGMVYRAFGWKQPITINFGMIYLPGAKLHTRDIKEMIEKGEVSGWDDIRLHTVRALIRRGFQPQAFKEMAEVTGLSKNDITLSWENLEGINRKIIDPLANRFMVVRDPAELSLKGTKKNTAEVDVHPDFPERGKRKMPVSGSVWVQKKDLERIKGEFRLIGLGNFRVKGNVAECTGDGIVKGMPKIQWVSSPSVDVEVLSPEGNWTGKGEAGMENLKKGDLVQMERIGFGRVDRTGKKLAIAFTHR